MEVLIGNRVLGMVAGDIEALLSENQSSIDEAYQNVGKGFKISIGVNLSPAPQGVEAEIKLSFARETVEAPEKCTAKMKRVMSESQEELPLADKVYRMEPK